MQAVTAAATPAPAAAAAAATPDAAAAATPSGQILNTTLNFLAHTQTWTINNFSLCATDVEANIQSDEFEACGHRWRLVCYRTG